MAFGAWSDIHARYSSGVLEKTAVISVRAGRGTKKTHRESDDATACRKLLQGALTPVPVVPSTLRRCRDPAPRSRNRFIACHAQSLTCEHHHGLEAAQVITLIRIWR